MRGAVTARAGPEALVKLCAAPPFTATLQVAALGRLVQRETVVLVPRFDAHEICARAAAQGQRAGDHR